MLLLFKLQDMQMKESIQTDTHSTTERRTMNCGIGSGRENADPASVSRGWRLRSGTTADGGTTPHFSQHAMASSIHASNNISRDHSIHTHINTHQSLQPHVVLSVLRHHQTACSLQPILINIVSNSAPIILAYTPWAIKKGATFIFTITLANVDRFQ